jgi:pterin-4a-carbinolamine dehydratase
MTKTARYEITVRLNRKIVERFFFADYDNAMNFMDQLEERNTNHIIEFRDNDPFNVA